MLKIIFIFFVLQFSVLADRSTGKFSTFDDLQLFYQSWKVESPVGTIIIVHGLKDHSSRYDLFAKKLNEEGFSVYAYDLRGHGNSPGRPVYVKSFNDYVQDLTDFVRLVIKESHQKPFVFGHSMGGAIVNLYALKMPETVQGVILSAPALKVTEDTSWLKIQASKILGSTLPLAPIFNLKNKDFSSNPSIVAQMSQDPLIYQKPAPAITAKELINSTFTIQSSTSEFNVPFLALHGTNDRLTNPEGSSELYEKAKTSDKTLKIYEGIWHDLLLL